MHAPGQIRWNVLSAPLVRTALKWPLFPVSLQAVALAALCLLAANGFRGGGNPKTHLTTLLVWGLWWPAMIALALVFGRVWCTVCPLELAHRLADAAARRVGWRRRPLPRALRAGWAVLGGYLALQLLMALAGVHRSPRETGLLLLGLAAAAAATGLAFNTPRAFCRGLCPASALLSVYGRFTPLQLDVGDPEVCRRCSSRECVLAARRHRFDAKSCPSALRPFERRQQDGCVLCLQCAKSCPRGNVAFGLAAASAPSRRQLPLAPYLAAYLALDAGFMVNELVENVPWLSLPFHLLPQAVHRAVPIVPYVWLEALWFLGVFPLLLWSAVAAASYALGYRGRLSALLIAATTAAAPVIALTHLAKATSKAAASAAYLPGALANPAGQGQAVGAALPPVFALSVAGFAAVLVALGLVVQCRRSAGAGSRTQRYPAVAGLLIPGVILGFALLAWART